MSEPQDELLQGAEQLRPLLEPKGFSFATGEAGRGSGGRFATGRFGRGVHALTFSVRYGLGLVAYHVGTHCISHEEYLRYSGAWGKHAYPGFGGTIQDDFAALAQDLTKHIAAFLELDSTEFMRVVYARDAEPNKFKGFAALGKKP